MKNRLKSYTFWVSLSGAVIILIQSIASLFGYKFETELLESLAVAIFGVLVVLGIIKKPAEKSEPTTNEVVIHYEDVEKTQPEEGNMLTENEMVNGINDKEVEILVVEENNSKSGVCEASKVQTENCAEQCEETQPYKEVVVESDNETIYVVSEEVEIF